MGVPAAACTEQGPAWPPAHACTFAGVECMQASRAARHRHLAVPESPDPTTTHGKQQSPWGRAVRAVTAALPQEHSPGTRHTFDCSAAALTFWCMRDVLQSAIQIRNPMRQSITCAVQQLGGWQAGLGSGPPCRAPGPKEQQGESGSKEMQGEWGRGAEAAGSRAGAGGRRQAAPRAAPGSCGPPPGRSPGRAATAACRHPRAPPASAAGRTSR